MSSFDSLKDTVAARLLREEIAAENIVKRLTEVKSQIEPSIFDYTLLEAGNMIKGFDEISDAVDIIYEKAVIDPVGIYSRAYMDDMLPILEAEKNLAFVIGDVDRFHDYNNAYGHPQGDTALKTIALQFENSVKQNLVQDESSLVARYGGEEFCAFIRDYQRSISDLHNLAENMRAAVEQMAIPKSDEGAQFCDRGYKHRTITLAAGIRKEGESVRNLIQEVDRLLTKKDKGGRNKLHLRR